MKNWESFNCCLSKKYAVINSHNTHNWFVFLYEENQ